MKKNGSLNNHLRKFDELTSELRQCEVELEEQDIIRPAANVITESYSVTSEVLDGNSDLTVEKVKLKLRNQYQKLKNKVGLKKVHKFNEETDSSVSFVSRQLN